MPEPEQTENTSKANSEKSTDFEKMVSLTTLLGKMFFSFGVIIYAMGFLAANIYFGKYGVQTASLLRANCFITGFWLIIPLFIISMAFYWVWYVIQSKSYKTKTKKIIGVFLILFAASAVLFQFCWGMKMYGINVTYKWSSVLCMALLIILFFAATAHLYREGEHKHRYRGTLWFIGWGAPLLLIAMIMYITLFAEHVYPDIPYFLGGAKPVTVQVFTDPNSEINSSFRKCGFSPKGDGVWEGNLLLATGDEYFFAVAGDPNEGLCIRTGEIRAIKYHSEFRVPRVR
jgi:hypothetical protein